MKGMCYHSENTELRGGSQWKFIHKTGSCPEWMTQLGGLVLTPAGKCPLVLPQVTDQLSHPGAPRPSGFWLVLPMRTLGRDGRDVLGCAQSLSRVCPHGLQPTRLLCPWGFSRQEYWIGLPCPPPGDLPHPGTEPRSPALRADSLPI